MLHFVHTKHCHTALQVPHGKEGRGRHKQQAELHCRPTCPEGNATSDSPRVIHSKNEAPLLKGEPHLLLREAVRQALALLLCLLQPEDVQVLLLREAQPVRRLHACDSCCLLLHSCQHLDPLHKYVCTTPHLKHGAMWKMLMRATSLRLNRCENPAASVK